MKPGSKIVVPIKNDPWSTDNGGTLLAPSILVRAAQFARERAYAQYSARSVGVVLRTNSGMTHTGSSVENVAWDGYFPIEVAIARMVGQYGWYEQREPDRSYERTTIRDVYFCGEKTSDGRPPFPTGRDIDALWQFGVPDTKIYSIHMGRIMAIHELSDFERTRPQPPNFEKWIETSATLHERLKAYTPRFHITEFANGLMTRDHKTPEERYSEKDCLNMLRQQMRHAWAPYSGFPVAAMTTLTTGQVFFGCNVETGPNSAIHAEGTAIAKMFDRDIPLELVGDRLIKKLIVMGGKKDDGALVTPCGKCRQSLREHICPDATIQIAGPEGIRKTYNSFEELLADSFGPDNLGRRDHGRRVAATP